MVEHWLNHDRIRDASSCSEPPEPPAKQPRLSEDPLTQVHQGMALHRKIESDINTLRFLLSVCLSETEMGVVFQ